MSDAENEWLRRVCRFLSAWAATAFRLLRSLSLSSPWRPCSSSRPMVWPCALPGLAWIVVIHSFLQKSNLEAHMLSAPFTV